MRCRLVAGTLALAFLLSACGLKLPEQISLPTQITGGDPHTLEAATAADQERSDRYSSGDLAGTWLLSSRQFREGISQSDYVTYIQTCKSFGLPIKVEGVRMEGSDRAIVREGALGFKFSATMVYEDGHWLRAPDNEMVAAFGKPLSALIASMKANGYCSKDETPPTSAVPSSTTSTTTTQSPYLPPPTSFSTSDVSAAGTGGTGQLAAVRLGPRDGYDRLVMEFLDGVPGYTVGYRPLPAYEDGSGNEIPLPGANALVQVTFTGATGAGWSGGPRTYFGPSTVTADTAVVTAAKEAGDFEALLNWVVGLHSEVPFRVSVLDGPPRLVIDFEH